MSLLTEEQVLDLTASILENTGTVLSSVRKWNEKQRPAQPLAQFEPDWSKAPNNATSAALDLSWWITEHGNWSNSKRIATYERPVKSHPHAALMAKYAEVAARRPDPWVEFEFRVDESGWETPTTCVSFYTDFEYRHIGETK